MRFDPKTRRYIDSSGHTLPPSQVRKEVIGYITQQQERAKHEAEKLLNQTTSLSAFFLFMRSRVEAWQTVAGAIAYGGKAQMDAERSARIAAKVKSEKGYLKDFEEQTRRSFVAARTIASQVADSIEVSPVKETSKRLTPTQKAKVKKRVFTDLLTAAASEVESVARRAVAKVVEDEGLELLTASIAIDESLAADLIGGSIIARAEMYSDDAYATFQNNVIAREYDSGVTLGRRVLTEGENCDDCIAAATEEFVPLDELPEI